MGPADRQGGFETHIAQRSKQAMTEKCRIAAPAVKLLDASESVFVDEGSTTMMVTEQILALDRR